MSIIRQLAKLKQKEKSHEETLPSSANSEKQDSDKLQDIDPARAGPSTLRCDESGMGSVDFAAVQLSTSSISSKRSKKYIKYSDEDCYKIGKYGSENGPTTAARKFKNKYPNLNESTVRVIKKRYEELLRQEMHGITKNEIKKYRSPTGRPLLLGDLDGMVQRYLEGDTIARWSCVTCGS